MRRQLLRAAARGATVLAMVGRDENNSPSLWLSAPFDLTKKGPDGWTRQTASGGFWTPPLPDAGLCSADAGTVHCKPLPDSCQGAPSCGCVPESHNICDCEDVGGGLMVKCYYP